jgi:RNA polymerase sigma factor (TIGR02999 family)
MHGVLDSRAREVRRSVQEKSQETHTNLTELLAGMKEGDAAALSRLVPVVYDELKRMARAHLRREERGHVLQTTGLVHEAYLKLAGLERVSVVSREHFLALSARLMRQILVDHARRKRSSKRGSGVTVIGLDGVSVPERESAVDVLAIDEALSQLAAVDARQAQIVEMRFFAGLTAEETAGVLGISTVTVHRDWAMAKAWLHARLTG